MSTFSPHGDAEIDATSASRRTPDEPSCPEADLLEATDDELAAVEHSASVEIDLTTDPPRVVGTARAEPGQVFAGAAVYRPVVVSLVIAAAIVVGYGVVVLASLFFDGVSPDTSPFDSALPDRTIVGSRGSFTEPGQCSEVSGSVFVDGDGNAIADPWDPEYDYQGIEVVVETDTGLSRRMPVGPDGSWSRSLDQPAVTSVAVVGLAELATAGLWPGPRLLDEAGEAPIIGETCSLDLGMIWKPAGAPAPWVGPADVVAPDIDASVAADAAPSGWRAGIQVHGRIGNDLDGDGRVGPAEPGVEGAIVVLRREDGALAGTAITGADGAYALANLRPTAVYTVSVTAGETVTAVRAMGEPLDIEDPSQVAIETSAVGMSVWGLDFAVGGSPAPSASAGDDLGDTDRRNRNGP